MSHLQNRTTIVTFLPCRLVNTKPAHQTAICEPRTDNAAATGKSEEQIPVRSQTLRSLESPRLCLIKSASASEVLIRASGADRVWQRQSQKVRRSLITVGAAYRKAPEALLKEELPASAQPGAHCTEASQEPATPQ